MSTNELHDDNITHVGLNGMKIDPSIELPIYRQDEDFKDSLLANLYSTVELLKKELEQKNATIDKLLLHADKLCLHFVGTPKIVETTPSIISEDASRNREYINTQERDLTAITQGNTLNTDDDIDFKIHNKKHHSKNQNIITPSQNIFNKILLKNRFDGLPFNDALTKDVIDDENNSLDTNVMG